MQQCAGLRESKEHKSLMSEGTRDMSLDQVMQKSISAINRPDWEIDEGGGS